MTQSAPGAQTLDRPRAAIPALAGHKVILHKDDYHQVPYVVSALIKVIGALEQGEAESIANTAFTQGLATVIECPKEVAEHYQEQLEGYGLTVTIEAA
jgi:ATP-dependent Clp protease adapter protein ClpS